MRKTEREAAIKWKVKTMNTSEEDLVRLKAGKQAQRMIVDECGKRNANTYK